MDSVIFENPQLSKFQITYYGRDAEQHRLDMYDAAASFYGFSRTVAILGHFYSTGTINAHAPKSQVQVYLEVSEEGSFRQTVAAAAVGAVVGAPLTTFISRTLDDWIPAEDKQTTQIIELLSKQNEILERAHTPCGGQEADEAYPHQPAPRQTDQHVQAVDNFIEESADKINVIRSITANSFKDIFRPVGRSADYVGLTAGRTQRPIGAVNERAYRLIQADRPDDEVVSVVGKVNSFSRSTKTGILFSRDLGRGFRFDYSSKTPLTPEDDFSWSQFYQRPIRLNGRFVRFYDGKIKKMLVYTVERLDIDDWY